MSGDGHSKLTPPPVAEPLDEIILGDDAQEERTAHPPEVAVRRASIRPDVITEDSREIPKEARETKKRAKMTLRIPDDEVSRPNIPVAKPVDPPSEGPIVAQQIVSIGGPPDDTLELPTVREPSVMSSTPTPRLALGVNPVDEPGWTPYQPMVADGNGSGTHQAHDEPRHLPSEEIPVDFSGEELEPGGDSTLPRMPLPPLDSEEIKIEEPERVTDPGEVAEVEPEDLVSVESIPHPAHPLTGPNPHPPPLKTTTGKLPHYTPPPPAGVTGAALMAAAPAPAAMPVFDVTARSPSVPPVIDAEQAAAAPIATALLASAETTEDEAPIGIPPRGSVASGSLFMPPASQLAPPPMSDSAANRKKIRPWWEELFNDDYIRTMAKVNDAQIKAEATFIEESLGCEAGATLLDLACGTGRHAVELATRGYQVVGFDLSLSMLARASDEAQERGQKINFVQGDMREMTFEETFDGIFAWNTSFGFFDEEKNAAVVAKVHRALKKGGQFLLDVVNRDYIVRQAPSLAWFEGDGCICMDEMQIDFITSRMRVKRTLMMDDGRTKEIEYSIRVYALHELGKMLHDNGFRVAEVSGRTGTPGVFFGCESPRTLILAEKR